MTEEKRDARARFEKGTCGGPGRPKKPKQLQFQEAMYKTITETEWRRLLRTIYNEALDGNQKSREWLAKHILNKPIQATLEPQDNLDADEQRQAKLEALKQPVPASIAKALPRDLQ